MIGGGAVETTDGVARIIEGIQDIYHGKRGDIETESINIIRDAIFRGNEDLYNLSSSMLGAANDYMNSISNVDGELSIKHNKTKEKNYQIIIIYRVNLLQHMMTLLRGMVHQI